MKANLKDPESMNLHQLCDALVATTDAAEVKTLGHYYMQKAEITGPARLVGHRRHFLRGFFDNLSQMIESPFNSHDSFRALRVLTDTFEPSLWRRMTNRLGLGAQ